MEQKLRIAAGIIKEKYPSAAIPSNGNGFYQIVGFEKYKTSKYSNTIRKEIFTFQREHDYYFKLFLPKVKDKNGEKSFIYDMKVMNSSTQLPSLREVCAAAEVIDNAIHLILCTGENMDELKLNEVKFVPLINKLVSSDKAPLVILMTLDDQENPFFAPVTFEAEENCIELQHNDNTKRHVRCLDNRFRNSYRDLEHKSLMTHLRHINDNPRTNFYDFLSLVVYGDMKYGGNFKSMIFDFETEEENIETFVTLFDWKGNCGENEIANAERSIFLKEIKTKKLWKKAIQTRLDKGEVGTGELFAAASILNCPIYYKDMEWKIYFPLTSNYAELFDTPLLITRGIGNKLILDVSVDRDCLCAANTPNVDGPLHLLKEKRKEFIARELENKTCCEAPERRKFHSHLHHLKGSKIDHEERKPYTKPIPPHLKTIVEQLETEEREIDQINDGNGSIEQCISKEIFGDEFHEQEVREIIGDINKCNIKTCLQKAADWTQITVYVLCSNKWISFKPHKTPDRSPNCRYYITLLYKREDGKCFDRVTPQRGCNCNLPPPITFVAKEKIEANMPSTLSMARHKPMATFLLEDPSDDMFEYDEVHIPPFSPYSELRFIMDREDMKGRIIVMTKEHRFSLYRCISKIIFGTEKHYDCILETVKSEIKDNPSIYAQFVSSQTQSNQTTVSTEETVDDVYGTFRMRKHARSDLFKRTATVEQEAAQFLTDRLMNGLEVNDLGLIAIATVFQTPVYLLSTKLKENTFSTQWQMFIQIRTKQKPWNLSKRKHKSICEPNTYFITLFRSSTGQFYLLHPADGCNCQFVPPNEPGKEIQDLSYLSTEEINMFICLREVENSFGLVMFTLDNWISAVEVLESEYEKLIEIIEKRRNNVNKASITGASIGIVGSILIFAGIVAAPFTAGVSFPISIAGGVVGAVGGTTTIGAKAVEIGFTKCI